MYRMALLCAILAAPLASADDRDKGKGGMAGDQIDRLARRLERDAREMREEVISHFRRSRSYKDLEKHAKEIERLAGRLHKIGERDGRHNQVREVLKDIDEEVRELDRNVREMARDKDLDRRAFDHLRDEMTDMGRILYRIRREIP